MQTPVLEDTGDNLQYSSPIQSTSSPNSSWTSGGEAITITGSGFSDLAFSNITDDGINHLSFGQPAHSRDFRRQMVQFVAIGFDSMLGHDRGS